LEDQGNDAGNRLNCAEADDEDRRGLDGEGDESGNLLEVVLDQYCQLPPRPDWRQGPVRASRDQF
jgi:hypothetical protein